MKLLLALSLIVTNLFTCSVARAVDFSADEQLCGRINISSVLKTPRLTRKKFVKQMTKQCLDELAGSQMRFVCESVRTNESRMDDLLNKFCLVENKY